MSPKCLYLDSPIIYYKHFLLLINLAKFNFRMDIWIIYSGGIILSLIWFNAQNTLVKEFAKRLILNSNGFSYVNKVG